MYSDRCLPYEDADSVSDDAIAASEHFPRNEKRRERQRGNRNRGGFSNTNSYRGRSHYDRHDGPSFRSDGNFGRDRDRFDTRNNDQRYVFSDRGMNRGRVGRRAFRANYNRSNEPRNRLERGALRSLKGKSSVTFASASNWDVYSDARNTRNYFTVRAPSHEPLIPANHVVGPADDGFIPALVARAGSRSTFGKSEIANQADTRQLLDLGLRLETVDNLEQERELIKRELERLNCELEQTIQDKKTLQLRCEKLESYYDAANDAAMSLQEQLDEEKETTKILETQLALVNVQVSEYKKKADKAATAAALLEEQNKSLSHDIDVLQHKFDELQMAQDQFDEANGKLQSEATDLIELYTQRPKVSDLEKKRQNFVHLLAKEKSIYERITFEKVNVEREARGKETTVLDQMRKLEERGKRIKELERTKTQFKAELHKVVTNKRTVDKNVHELEQDKRILEGQVVEQKHQIDLEAILQLTEDSKFRLQVDMQTLKPQLERNLQVRDEKNETRKVLIKRIRDLEDERKQRATAVVSGKQLKSDERICGRNRCRTRSVIFGRN